MNRVDLIASRTGDLPALPEVVARVLELVADPSTRIQHLVDVISRDQALTARVLRMSNSAFYGVRGTVANLDRAIVVLGFNTLRSIVMASATKGMYRTRGSCFKDRILWEHSLAVALASRTLATECRYNDTGTAFIGGLLHDVGKVVLDNNLGEEYQAVIEQVYNDGQTFVEAEKEVLGFDHTEVGALVVRHWNLTPEIQEAVRLHHAVTEAGTDQQLCAIVSLANSMCVKLEIGPERRPDLDLSGLESARMLAVSGERLAELSEEVKRKLREEKQLLSVA